MLEKLGQNTHRQINLISWPEVMMISYSRRAVAETFEEL
jgi:hypothetical protein